MSMGLGPSCYMLVVVIIQGEPPPPWNAVVMAILDPCYCMVNKTKTWIVGYEKVKTIKQTQKLYVCKDDCTGAC